MRKKNSNTRNKKTSKKNTWIILITIWTFFLAVGFNFISEVLLTNRHILISFIILLIIIFIGIFFDMIGIAVASTDLTPFNSMASNRVRGAKDAVDIVKNASQVSNFCNDVVGDICGIISGATSISIAYQLLTYYSILDISFTIVILNGFVASITVGGKAIGKNIALGNSTEIVYKAGYIISIIKGIFGNKK
ncbi:MAG: hypothetical protein ACOWWH_05555 [Eubacteriaceae bacterium]